MILPNVRASFGKDEVECLLALLGDGDADARRAHERRLNREGMDALLDDPRSFNALMAGDRLSAAPPALLYYLLVRHALLEGGMHDRMLADYLAAMLLAFGKHGRAHAIEDESDEEFHYLVDIMAALPNASGRRAFLLHAHLGNFALWLSGLFPDRIAARVRRRGAPDLSYYEELGATGYRIAAASRDADSHGLDRVYEHCATSFSGLRVALNRLADRYFFPQRGASVDRLLRQVADRLHARN